MKVASTESLQEAAVFARSLRVLINRSLITVEWDVFETKTQTSWRDTLFEILKVPHR